MCCWQTKLYIECVDGSDITISLYKLTNVIFKNVSSSTSHKKTPTLRLYVREFKKILPNISFMNRF